VFSMLIMFLIGLLVGAIAMYLIARNSPEHFLKCRKFVDAVESKLKAKITEIK